MLVTFRKRPSQNCTAFFPQLPEIRMHVANAAIKGIQYHVTGKEPPLFAAKR